MLTFELDTVNVSAIMGEWRVKQLTCIFFTPSANSARRRISSTESSTLLSFSIASTSACTVPLGLLSSSSSTSLSISSGSRLVAVNPAPDGGDDAPPSRYPEKPTVPFALSGPSVEKSICRDFLFAVVGFCSAGSGVGRMRIFWSCSTKSQ